jgi:hypothetical protein
MRGRRCSQATKDRNIQSSEVGSMLPSPPSRTRAAATIVVRHSELERLMLQGAQRVEHGRITATWFVVPGSGTDELTGLRGEGGFAGEFGKGSEGTLDYWFEPFAQP